MSTCHRSEIESLVFGGLTPERASVARAHLAACDACRAEHDRLLLERGLFADRRRACVAREATDPLPRFDTIVALSEKPRGLVARWVERSLGFWGIREGRLGQIAIAATAGVCVLGVAHNRPSSVLPSRAIATETATSPSPSHDSSARNEAVSACDEQSVCQVSRQTLPLIDGQVSLAMPSEPSPVKCSPAPMASILPGPLDRTRSESEAMCIADAI